MGIENKTGNGPTRGGSRLTPRFVDMKCVGIDFLPTQTSAFGSKLMARHKLRIKLTPRSRGRRPRAGSSRMTITYPVNYKDPGVRQRTTLCSLELKDYAIPFLRL
ncbi:hypothetical protein EVAR_56181_1 [Eumeta japonica]|uniref:Uncharacterized protein n=1 Tax=Eumeta variegata TaxID=151549 RepID=A0A4C1ZX94_EUMVA|nr:hypothetical protein EVAR_56181_1 [Eumeta japonica]